MNRLTVYDPFSEVFPELMRAVFPTAGIPSHEPLGIRVDVKESSGEYQVSAEVPGVKKDDIHVEIDGNHVSISAEVRKETEEKDGERLLRSERYHGSVARSFTLGAEVDEDRASARYENGVLELTLPKKKTVAAKRLRVS